MRAVVVVPIVERNLFGRHKEKRKNFFLLLIYGWLVIP